MSTATAPSSSSASIAAAVPTPTAGRPHIYPAVYCPPCISQHAHTSHAKRIISVIKAVRGEVYGECVRNMLHVDAQNKSPPAITRIHCRVNDRHIAHILVTLLGVDYKVAGTNVSSDFSEGTYIIRMSAPCDPGVITLDITTMPRNMWRLDRPSFDIDTLASNSQSLYVYTVPSPGDPAHPIDVILSRVMSKKFALLHHDSTGKKTAIALKHAVDLVASGWIMDDRVLGARGWLASFWKDVRLIRRNPIAISDECSICQEKFRASDIVVVLPCSHAFHGFCDQKHCTGGICTWVETNASCPCCRRVICGN